MKKILSFLIISVVFLSGCTELNQAIDNSDLFTDGNSTSTQSNENSEIEILDLSNQELEKIPDYVFENTNLEELDISGNKISGAIQSQIRELKNLKILDASNNEMTGLPAEIGQLLNLETLNISNNQLTGLPNELGNLKNLKILNISGNNYSVTDLKTITEKLPESVNIIK